MRAAIWIVGLAGLLAACAPQRAPDRAACVGLFQEYDRFAQFRDVERFDRRRDIYRVDPFLSRLHVLLVQNDCQTRARDLGNLEAVAAARVGQDVAERGARLGRPVAVHVGALTSESDASRAVEFFTGMGLRTTGIGNRQLGRRVYVGPVETQGALDEVLAIAREAGFVAPYPSQFFRF